jgi:hypothetical protein
MRAIKVGEHISLSFTTVIDEMSRGLVDEDEDANAAPADRTYWESKASKQTVAVADQLLAVVREFDPTFDLKYNKFYIGLSKNCYAYNFVIIRPRRNFVICEIKLIQSDETQSKLDGSGLETLDYDTRWGLYRIRLGTGDFLNHVELLKDLMRLAFDTRSS